MPERDILFFDIGGVCLTNGWDRHARAAAVERFELDAEEVADRHDGVSEAFECGHLPLDTYLDAVIFYRPRTFEREDFVRFMESRSQPHREALAVVAELADSGRYRLATINNESRELNQYRIETFGLDRWFDAFFTSCFVGTKKPGPRIYRTAMDVMQADPARCLFVDDRLPNVEGALAVGLRGLHAREPGDLRGLLRGAGVEVGV